MFSRPVLNINIRELPKSIEPEGKYGSPKEARPLYFSLPRIACRVGEKVASLSEGKAQRCVAQMIRAETANEAKPTVIIVDDDVSVRDSLEGLLRSVGLEVRAFPSVPEFLKSGRPDGPTCLVLDVRLPGRSGLDFQRELAESNIHLPVIFITGHGDVPMSVQAMKRGALEFLTKPFRDQDLLDAIQLGLARDRTRLEAETAVKALRQRFETLTLREREVMAGVVKGRLNKQIAGDLGISEVTVKVHRGQVMRKMRASSLPDLARMADQLNLGRNVP